MSAIASAAASQKAPQHTTTTSLNDDTPSSEPRSVAAQFVEEVLTDVVHKLSSAPARRGVLAEPSGATKVDECKGVPALALSAAAIAPMRIAISKPYTDIGGSPVMQDRVCAVQWEHGSMQAVFDGHVSDCNLGEVASHVASSYMHHCFSQPEIQAIIYR